MNICFIGDSHIAAIRHGWDRLRDEYPEIAITFFSAQRSRFAHLAVCGGTLVPQDEDLREVMRRSCNFEPVITADYDRYVLCGLEFSTMHIVKQLGHFRSEDQASDKRAPVSSGCYLRAIAGCLRESMSMQVARKVRAITSRPLTIFFGPRVNDENEQTIYARLRESGDAARVAGYFLEAAAAVCGEVDADFIQQPPQTLSDPLQTLSVYAKDAPREFNITPRPEGRKDYQHMNGAYGELMLRALFVS